MSLTSLSQDLISNYLVYHLPLNTLLKWASTCKSYYRVLRNSYFWPKYISKTSRLPPYLLLLYIKELSKPFNKDLAFLLKLREDLQPTKNSSLNDGTIPSLLSKLSVPDFRRLINFFHLSMDRIGFDEDENDDLDGLTFDLVSDKFWIQLNIFAEFTTLHVDLKPLPGTDRNINWEVFLNLEMHSGQLISNAIKLLDVINQMSEYTIGGLLLQLTPLIGCYGLSEVTNKLEDEINCYYFRNPRHPRVIRLAVNQLLG